LQSFPEDHEDRPQTNCFIPLTLSVDISSDLSWVGHINRICSNARQYCQFHVQILQSCWASILARLCSSTVWLHTRQLWPTSGRSI